MSWADWLGSAGVALLLGAYLANLVGWLERERHAYHALNALGAGLACFASWLIGFLPFVALEGAWLAVALAALVHGRHAGGDGGTRTPDTADMSRLL